MGWQSRRKNGRYFYTSKKVAGRAEKTYWGDGLLARQAEALVRIDRINRACRRAQLAILNRLDAESRELHRGCNVVWRAAAVAAGYRSSDGTLRKMKGFPG